MSAIVRSPEAQAAFDASTRAPDEARYQRDNACRLLRHAVACLDLGKRVAAGRSPPSTQSQAALDEYSQSIAEIEAIARRLEGA